MIDAHGSFYRNQIASMIEHFQPSSRELAMKALERLRGAAQTDT